MDPFLQILDRVVEVGDEEEKLLGREMAADEDSSSSSSVSSPESEPGEETLTKDLQEVDLMGPPPMSPAKVGRHWVECQPAGEDEEEDEDEGVENEEVGGYRVGDGADDAVGKAVDGGVLVVSEMTPSAEEIKDETPADGMAVSGLRSGRSLGILEVCDGEKMSCSEENRTVDEAPRSPSHLSTFFVNSPSRRRGMSVVERAAMESVPPPLLASPQKVTQSTFSGLFVWLGLQQASCASTLVSTPDVQPLAHSHGCFSIIFLFAPVGCMFSVVRFLCSPCVCRFACSG